MTVKTLSRKIERKRLWGLVQLKRRLQPTGDGKRIDGVGEGGGLDVGGEGGFEWKVCKTNKIRWMRYIQDMGAED